MPREDAVVKSISITLASVFALSLALGGTFAVAQSSSGAVASHVAAAKQAAGQDWSSVFTTTCNAAASDPQAARGRGTAAPAAPRPPGPPERSTWYAEPVKVFDNLYFLGQTEYSAWAVTTSAGTIIIDTIFDYSVADEVEAGMKKMGLDPAGIKYVIVSHGHGDHSGGAKFLQDKYGARVILAAEDWDLLDRSNGTKPKRDMSATDGMKLTLGDTTLTIYKTPGHTLGTISTLIPVKDRGQPHLVAYWGGTAFNWVGGPQNYITPERPDRFWFKTYSDSARKFRDIASREGADVIVSNHTNFDGSKEKLPTLKTRKPGEPNPYVIGKEGVIRYLTVVDECAQAGLARVSQ
jgi:metallo-beta-lactamase class B